MARIAGFPPKNKEKKVNNHLFRSHKSVLAEKVRIQRVEVGNDCWGKTNHACNDGVKKIAYL